MDSPTGRFRTGLIFAACAALGAAVLADEPAAPVKQVPNTPGAPLPEATPQAVDAAIRRGVDFLLASQNANGSWGSATRTKDLDVYCPIPGGHHAFRAGTTGLAFSGLLDARDPRPEAAAAIDRAAAWTRAELPKLRRADLGSTYNLWGHAYGLRSITRLYQRETDPARRAELKQLAEGQISLANKYEDVNGGWGYYDMDDLATKRPSGLPTSFSTATVLLAMREARDAMGVTLDDKIVKSSLASIEMQRTPDFAYTYAFEHRLRPRSPINRPAGSLARSQACNACLRAFNGDGLVTDRVITDWADRFLAREGFLSIGRKRPIPHETHFQISGYFYFYGVYYFTESVAFLPKEQRAKYARQLAAVLLDLQEKDGSWWDYPLYNYHQPYGTGYSLMALAWCRTQMANSES